MKTYKNTELLTPQEVADKLKLSKYTIYNLMKRGDLPHMRIGNSYRVSEEDLNEFLNQNLMK